MHIQPSRWIGTALAAGLLAASAPAVVGAEHQAIQPVASLTKPSGPAITPRTETAFDLKSAQGQDYRIFVSAPESESPPDGFPVIYVLDANAWFGLAAEVARLNRPDAVVVGIGYPVDAYFGEARRRDYVPFVASPPEGQRYESQALDGNADGFRAFIVNELKPLIAKEHTIDPAQETLFGHSAGGLFTLHALLTEPGSFETYLVASPSIHANNAAILEAETGLAAGAIPSSTRVMLTVGIWEQYPGDGYDAHLTGLAMRRPELLGERSLEELIARSRESAGKGSMVDDTAEMARRLEARGLKVAYVPIEGEDHMSVVPASLNRAIPFALTPAD